MVAGTGHHDLSSHRESDEDNDELKQAKGKLAEQGDEQEEEEADTNSNKGSDSEKDGKQEDDDSDKREGRDKECDEMPSTQEELEDDQDECKHEDMHADKEASEHAEEDEEDEKDEKEEEEEEDEEHEDNERKRADQEDNEVEEEEEETEEVHEAEEAEEAWEEEEAEEAAEEVAEEDEEEKYEDQDEEQEEFEEAVNNDEGPALRQASSPGLPSREPRRWTGKVLNEQAMPYSTEMPALTSKSSSSGNRAQDSVDSVEASSSALLRKEMRRLEGENKHLRTEIGQERYKVQQLSKMKEEASLAQRREMEARKKEAQAIRELQGAKEYVEKKNVFALNEKADLLQRIKSFEVAVRESSDREYALRIQLQEALAENARLLGIHGGDGSADRLRKECAEFAAKLKRAEQHQERVEQKRLDDKATVKVLAAKLKAAVEAGFVAEEGICADGKAKRQLPVTSPPLCTAPQPTRRHVQQPAQPSQRPPSRRPVQATRAEDKSRTESFWPADLWALSALRQRIISLFKGDDEHASVQPSGAAAGKQARHIGSSAPLSNAKGRAAPMEEAILDSRQQYVVGALVVFIAFLAALKLYS